MPKHTKLFDRTGDGVALEFYPDGARAEPRGWGWAAVGAAAGAGLGCLVGMGWFSVCVAAWLALLGYLNGAASHDDERGRP